MDGSGMEKHQESKRLKSNTSEYTMIQLNSTVNKLDLHISGEKITASKRRFFANTLPMSCFSRSSQARQRSDDGN